MEGSEMLAIIRPGTWDISAQSVASFYPFGILGDSNGSYQSTINDKIRGWHEHVKISAFQGERVG